jgi:hypothetical protein
MSWPHRITPVLLLTAVLVFYTFTIRDGHGWDDDAGQYIMHARNLAEGRPYREIEYIFNPEYSRLGPPSASPGFPLMLAPVWAAAGMNLRAMKVLEIGFFVSSLGILYLLYRTRLSFSSRLALIAIVGFNPVFWPHVSDSDFEP